MRRVQLDRNTLRHQRRWTAAALGFALVASAAPVLGGGSAIGFRMIAGLVTVAGTLGACRFRTMLYVPVLSVLTAAALLPDDATIDPAVVAAVSAVSILLCVEVVAVARRLVTAAPVRSVTPDIRALLALASASTLAVVGVAAFAQLDRVGGRVLVLGLPVAAIAIVTAVVGTRPTMRDIEA